MASSNPDPKRPVGAPRQLDSGKRVNVYLDAESLELAANLGDGNVSEGIRRALKTPAVLDQKINRTPKE